MAMVFTIKNLLKLLTVAISLLLFMPLGDAAITITGPSSGGEFDVKTLEVIPQCSAPTGLQCTFSPTGGIIRLDWNAVSGAANYKMEWARADLAYGDTTGTSGGTSRITAGTSGNTLGLNQRTWFKFHTRVETDGTVCSAPAGYSSDVQCFTGVCDMSPSHLTDTVTLPNQCVVTITHKAFDKNDLSGGLYKTESSTSSSRTVIFDDNPVATDCDTDLKFKNSWSTGTTTSFPYSLGVTAQKIEKKGCGFLGLFCPHDLDYGFTVSSSNCKLWKFLEIGTFYGSSHTFWIPDTQSFGSNSYHVGECATNEDCINLKGQGWTCGSDKICKTSVCGNGIVEAGEQCDPPGSTASCPLSNGDAGRKTCLATCGWGECRPTCQKNEDCGDKRCCLGHTAPPEASGPLARQTTREAGDCVSKQVYAANSAYLCDPGTWIICDESKVGSKQEFDNRVFICNKENGIYKWEEKIATAVPQTNKNEGFVIDLPSIIRSFIGIFGIFFV